jgi:hypothetical protein
LFVHCSWCQADVSTCAAVAAAAAAECFLQAAKAKVCQVLGLVAGTEASLVQVQSQVLALQQRLWEVAAWRPLLAVAWQLQEAEQWLAAELTSLQQAEEQQGCADSAGSSANTGITSSSKGILKSSTPADPQGVLPAGQQQAEQQDKDSEYSSVFAGLLGWDGPSAASAAAANKKAKVGRLLLQLADRQAELTRTQRHVQRLASILMAGVDDEVLGQVQRGIEAQLQQVERSRMGVRQQMQELRAAAAPGEEQGA